MTVKLSLTFLDAPNGRAAFLMAFAALGYSAVPLFAAWGDGGSSPFIFAAAWRIGLASGGFLFLLAFRSRLTLSGRVWRLAGRRTLSLPMLIWTVSYVNIALYALAIRFVDVAVAAALYETWPMMLVLITGKIFRGEERYLRIDLASWLLLATAFVGAALAVASQSGGFLFDASALASGAFLALGAGFLSALSAFGIKLAVNLASDLVKEELGKKEPLELFSAVLGMSICNLINMPIIAFAGFALGESLSWTAILFGFAGGLAAGAVPAIFWRKANLIARDLTLNVMLYLTPALSLFWLWLFSLTGNVRLGLLASGVLLTVLANVGLYANLRRNSSKNGGTKTDP